jgi:hypothetical protein
MAQGKGGAGAGPEFKRARFQDMRKRVPASSERFKDKIKPMDKASEAILALPVIRRSLTPMVSRNSASWLGSGKGESRSRGPLRRRKSLHRALRSSERDVAQRVLKEPSHSPRGGFFVHQSLKSPAA